MLPSGWRSWFVTGLMHPRLRVRPRPKSKDFHDAENRQRPCHYLGYGASDPKCHARNNLGHGTCVPKCHARNNLGYGTNDLKCHVRNNLGHGTCVSKFHARNNLGLGTSDPQCHARNNLGHGTNAPKCHARNNLRHGIEKSIALLEFRTQVEEKILHKSDDAVSG
ncbi:hypothetical protein TNCV_3254321 [Trichonephila clavipes]|nr:hypothetical protein TNCV_3254321 [Trichonephila clavipes]